MIEAKDLRVNNLIHAHAQDPVEVVVETIGHEGVNFHDLREGVVYDYEFQELSGIPLTAEWLENFGFEAYSGWFYRNDKLVIEACLSRPEWSVRIRTSEESSIYLRNIKHVHQLMNLHFALTNTELTLKSI